jgi:Fe-Mn family superoxide dismutase
MPHELPELSYAYDALEPHIDARTMEIHHSKHHAGYTANLNSALENAPDLANKTAAALVADLASVPDAIRTAVQNNGGGFVNHSLFWKVMGPGSGGEPEGSLASAVSSAFGDFTCVLPQLSEPPCRLYCRLVERGKLVRGGRKLRSGDGVISDETGRKRGLVTFGGSI